MENPNTTKHVKLRKFKAFFCCLFGWHTPDRLPSDGYHDGNLYEKRTYIGKQVDKLRLRIRQGDYRMYKLIQENPQLAKKLKEFDKRMKSFNLENQMKKVGDE